jgi:hypothetical protein
LTVKEIKNILDKLGVKRDDCFEKGDLVNRLKEAKSGKVGGAGGSKTDFNQRPQSGNYNR